MVRKKIDLAPGNKAGFGFLEIIMAITILGLLGALAIPNFLRQQAGYEQKKFVTSLNAVMSEVWQQALMSEKMGKVKLDFRTRTVTVEQATGKTSEEGNPEFEPVFLHYAQNNLQWPETLEFKQFFINQQDEMAARGVGGTTHDLWFYVMPSGMAQEVVANIVDTRYATADSDGKELSLVLNPFTLQFRTYHEFQIPSA